MSEFSIIPPSRRKGRCPTCDSIIRAVLTIDAMSDTSVRCDKCDAHVLPVWDKPAEPKTYTPTYSVSYEGTSLSTRRRRKKRIGSVG